MPYLDDGTPVDMVLNPLGVPSRMNIGQTWRRSWAGPAAVWAGSSTTPCMPSVKRGHAEALRGAVINIYGADDGVAKFKDSELVMLAERIKDGVHVATPVFDGAREPEIVEMLKGAPALAERPASGQAPCSTGRTGDPFDHEVTVGCMYMLKLHHFVDDKIHARSIGPYAWSPSNRWAARRSSAASASARWRCGRWRPTAPPTRCRRC